MYSSFPIFGLPSTCRRRRWRSWWLLLVLLGLGQVRAEVLIATVGPMSGVHAWSGEQFRRGAQLAVDDINRGGGLLGQRLRLLIGDDAGDREQATAVAEKLARDGVRLVVGHRASDTTLAAMEVYAGAGVVQITPSATNPALTERGVPTLFRICGRDDRQGAMAGELLAERWSDQPLGIVHDGSSYGLGLAERTRAGLRKAGIRVALFGSYSPQSTDFRALLAQLAELDIKVLYLGGYSTDAGLILRQAGQAGLTLQLVAGDALHNADFALVAGPAAEGTLFTFDDDPRELASAQEVVARFRAEGYEPEGYTLHTYAAVQAWATAAMRVGSIHSDTVSAAMHKASVDTVIGRLAFDTKGDRVDHRYRWYRWQDGSYRRYEH